MERLLNNLNEDHAKDTKWIKKQRQHVKYNHAVKVIEKYALESKCEKLNDSCNVKQDMIEEAVVH